MKRQAGVTFFIGVLLFCSSWGPFGPKPLERATSISLSTRGHLNDPNTLIKLSTSLPNATRKGDLVQSIFQMLTRQVGAKERDLTVVRRSQFFDINDGLAGDPIFFVKTAPENIRYVIKAYRDEQKLACELSAFDLLTRVSFRQARVPALAAVGRASTSEGSFSLLAYDYLPGEQVTSLVKQVGRSGECCARQRAFEVVDEAITRVGFALAELHNARVEVSYEQPPYFARREERMLEKFIDSLEKHPQLLGMSKDEFVSLFRALQEARSASLRCHTYAHLDPHLGNWLYDEGRDTLSMIDLQTLHYSIGEGGKPLASPWFDYFIVYFNIEGMGCLYGLSHHEVGHLRESFHNAYWAHSTLPLPTPEEIAFHSLYYWMRMIGIFSRLAPGEVAQIASQKKEVVEWSSQRLSECLDDLVADNRHSKCKKDRKGELPAREWMVRL